MAIPPGTHTLLNDETLRDGLQNPSIHDPAIEEKIEILHLMESLRIDAVNIGLPGAGPRAAEHVYSELKNVIVWVKTTPAQGSFYRSQHELIFAFKNGDAPHINNFELGQHGRNRSNVWTYPGVNTFRAGRMDDLGMHPTVKPVALVVDALRDCSRRGDIVLDPFMGSGTTIMAAERLEGCGPEKE